MPTGTGILYYVLREGSTREEQWSWSDVEGLCRSGELTPRARIFLPDENRWAAIGETRLSSAFGSNGHKDGGEQPDDGTARLEQEYKDALERVEQNPDVIEPQLDAGILAGQLGRKEEARAHFQSALHRYPYHARTAQEVRRRFSKAEQKTFRYLERPAPVWDDLGEMLTVPLARGPLYVVIPAAVMIALLWLPAGGVVVAALIFLWSFQMMEYTARGATRPADWNRSFKDPWRKLGRPALLMSAVVGQWLFVLLGPAKLVLVAQGRGESIGAFVARSPVFLVVGAITGILYLPVAMVSLGGFTGSIAKTLHPLRLARTVTRMEHEYVYSVALIAGLSLVMVLLNAILGSIPVVGDVVLGAALAYATPVCGLILGRLLGRMGHVIE